MLNSLFVKFFIVIITIFATAYINYACIDSVINLYKDKLIGYPLSNYYVFISTIILNFIIVYYYALNRIVYAIMSSIMAYVISWYSITILIMNKYTGFSLISIEFQELLLLCAFAAIPIISINILMYTMREDISNV